MAGAVRHTSRRPPRLGEELTSPRSVRCMRNRLSRSSRTIAPAPTKRGRLGRSAPACQDQGVITPHLEPGKGDALHPFDHVARLILVPGAAPDQTDQGTVLTQETKFVTTHGPLLFRPKG